MQSVLSFTPTSGINAAAHRKEKQPFYSFSLIDLDNAEESAVIRLYYSASGARNYACLWILRDGFYASGSGKAGGYGYHRPSAAAQEAFTRAGVKLAEPIDGRGDSEIEYAMRALADHMGIARSMILRANG
jgi:hypothetical protein